MAATYAETTPPRSPSGNPLSRIAHKIAHLRSETPRSNQADVGDLKDSLENNAAASSGQLRRLRRSILAEKATIRREVRSAPEMHEDIVEKIDVTPPMGTSSLVSSSQVSPRTSHHAPRRENEEPEPPESLDKYGEEAHTEPLPLMTVVEASQQPVGTKVTFRARIHTQRRMSKHLDFLLFRDQTDTIQGVLTRAHPNMIRWVQKLSPESIVQVTGLLQTPVEDVRSANHPGIEVNIDTIYLVSPANHPSFTNYKPPDVMNRRLSSRVLDLRNPANQALFKVRAVATRTFRRSLDDRGFLEIQTPKLQPAATETGASVFKVNYFGRRAFLAQSPQLAKQMAISADFGRVYEIGPVFRAENSNTHRHLTEYTGLDIEMTLEHSYHELIKVVDGVVKDMITVIQDLSELETVRTRWPSNNIKLLDETPIIPFKEGLRMLREDGRDVEEDDLGTRDEIRLGELVKEKYGADYYILDKFPAVARPFYTHKAEDRKWTNSFDAFVRGQEICTGGQRIIDPQELRESMADAGIAEADMSEYLSAFDLGAPPHGGAGLGLDRLIALLLDLGDIRYATLFHRDPKSLPARPLSLPHPNADTTKPRIGHDHPPIEDLIANYGDASNTSWLDDRFQIWRHHTGAAVGYVRQDRLVMVVGDPLCDPRQYKEVTVAFVDFCVRQLKLTPIWLLVSEDVQEILGQHLGWRTLSCVEEQRIDGDGHAGPNGHTARRAHREGIKVHEVRLDDAFMRRADRAINAWKAQRKGRQIHLTEIRPWIDARHRRYFAAEKDGQVLGLVVLAQLAPRNGWQVKWALDFPGAPNGTIDVLVNHSLAAIPGPVTFGASAAEKLTAGEHLHGARARVLEKSYDAIFRSLGLARRSEFRQKFGVLGEQVYICYPKHDVSVRDLREIVKFFEH